MREHKKCICGRGFYDDTKTKARKYCKVCEALAKKRKRPVIMIRGGCKK